MSLFNKKSSVEQDLAASNQSNIIGKGTSITGDIESAGNLRIDGKLKGNIKCKSKVALGEGSVVEGNIVAQNAEIQGEVLGIIDVSDVLILKNTAKVSGDIRTVRLVIEDGAQFIGNCKMGGAKINGNGVEKHEKERIKEAV
jgi:cytoskeletal protein CcmA (bactofilin family)